MSVGDGMAKSGTFFTNVTLHRHQITPVKRRIISTCGAGVKLVVSFAAIQTVANLKKTATEKPHENTENLIATFRRRQSADQFQS